MTKLLTSVLLGIASLLAAALVGWGGVVAAQGLLPGLGSEVPQGTEGVEYDGLDWFALPADRLDAVTTYNDAYLWVFQRDRFINYKIVEDAQDGGLPLEQLKGWPANWVDSIDAAVQWDMATILLFRGGEYVTYDLDSQGILSAPMALNRWPGWPPGWTGGIDAAARWDKTTLMFFKDDSFVIFEMEEGRVVTDKIPLSELKGWPQDWESVDAVVNPGDGWLYFFDGSTYLQFNLDTETMKPRTAILLPSANVDAIDESRSE